MAVRSWFAVLFRALRLCCCKHRPRTSPVDRWGKLVRKANRLAFKRRSWAALGTILNNVKKSGREDDGTQTGRQGLAGLAVCVCSHACWRTITFAQISAKNTAFRFAMDRYLKKARTGDGAND
eukprot:7182107-Alexandrium_andersonii.AAC.1